MFLFSISALEQSTYFVSNSVGDDNTGNGSVDSPFETIGKAISVIDAGDTVIIRGDYITKKSQLITLTLQFITH